MEKRNVTLDSTGRPVHLEWAVDAVVNDNSIEFAVRLQEILNARTTSGFQLMHMLSRTVDNGLVVTFQKATFLDIGPAPVAQGTDTTGENDGLH